MLIDGQTSNDVVLIDNFTADDEARGVASNNEKTISDKNEFFDRLQALSDYF